MRRNRFGLGGVAMGVVGTVGVLMLIPNGNADTAPRQSAVSTSPVLATFLDKAVETRPAEKTSAQVIAEVASGPEPGQPAPVTSVVAPQTVAATTAPPPVTAEPAEARELSTARTAVNMRAGPSTSNPTLFVLQPDEQVAVLERQGGWTRVEKTNGATGWVYGSYLSGGSGDDVDRTVTGSIEPVTQPTPRTERKPVRQAKAERAEERTTNLTSIRLRAAPSRNAETVFSVEPGTPLRIAERRKGWARVVVPGGMSGWVRVK